MLHVTGQSFDRCDGVSRRDLLRVGVLGLGGMSLPELLRQRAQASERRTTSVIFIELAGGPTHFETYDPKPQAPIEFRGPLEAIPTNVPGVYFSEFMREQARIMDRLAVLRSVTHDSSSHGTSAHLTQTGFYLQDRQGRTNSSPAVGSVAARLRGANAPGLPAYVSVPRTMRYGNAAFLGKAYNPFEVVGDPSQKNFKVNNLTLSDKLSLERLDERKELLRTLDQGKRIVDQQGVADSLDKFSTEAFELVTSDRAVQAFDLKREASHVRETYGQNTIGQSMLLARRLVEAGVTFVSVTVGGWDDHGQIAKSMERKGPNYDRGVAALVRDLAQRGMEQDVMVVAMGEFGRTPRVNNNAGRDHWGPVMSVLMAGGGLNVGQVVGSSSSKGETAQDSPYRPEHILATIYQHLGVDPSQTFLDLAGRPRYILERRDLVSELV